MENTCIWLEENDMENCPLVSRQQHSENTVFKVGDNLVGGRRLTIMAGPCAVENRDGLLQLAVKLKEAGAQILRGGGV